MQITPRKAQSALVLGGGGVTGIAWMTGIFAGLAQGGIASGDFERVIGSSAGAALGAQICADLPIAALFARQVETALQVAEMKPKLNYLRMAWTGFPAFLARNNQALYLKRVGAMALKARGVAPAERLGVIAARLPSHDWPTRQDLACTAINAATGVPVLFERDSGVGLVDAVAASCAVPGVWPVVRINGDDYYDGALRTGENADYAAGAKRVLIISPQSTLKPGTGLSAEIDLLKAGGSHVALIQPNAAARQAMGSNSLDPAQRAPSAQAGFAQAQNLAAKISAALGQ
ncbi:MAG: patatin-like phospholipase family protein [Rhodobacteraceae bacterium]|nr:patatin-like phospholipase family protein [Paracoccaceae bacterium]